LFRWSAKHAFPTRTGARATIPLSVIRHDIFTHRFGIANTTQTSDGDVSINSIIILVGSDSSTGHGDDGFNGISCKSVDAPTT
jgi:hypothetical protein